MYYGYDVAPVNDPFVALVEVTQDVFERGVSLRWHVNHAPVLRYVPTWFPGAGFSDTPPRLTVKLMNSFERPLKYVLDKMVGQLGA